MKKIIIGISAFIIIIVVSIISHTASNVVTVKDFNTCIEAGYPVMESYPRQCRTPEGTVYVENIQAPKEGDLVKPDITTGDHVKSPLMLTGKARGNWFFEGQFPVVLLDGKGNKITEGNAVAQGEWMTEAYVPFKVTLTFNHPGTETGVISFQKNNPTGETLHDSSYKVAVIFDKPKVSTSTPTPIVGSCVVSGCSGQICSDKSMVSTCEYRDSYACYKTATCARQQNGQCGWTVTNALTQCLQNSSTTVNAL